MDFETQPRIASATTKGQRQAISLWNLNQCRWIGQHWQEARVRGGNKAHLGDGSSKEARLGI